MSVKKPTGLSSPLLLSERRLLHEADRRGTLDGITTHQELVALKRTLEAQPTDGFQFDVTARAREKSLSVLISSTPVGTIVSDASIRKLPTALRLLANELDAHWGDADGKVSVEEFDRVAAYYLAALPFFCDEAQTLLELAEHLGYAQRDSTKVITETLSTVTERERELSRPFTELFHETVKAKDLPGAPGALREAALHSPKWHRLSVLEHSAFAVKAIRDLADTAGVEWKGLASTMLLHDVGKVLDRDVDLLSRLFGRLEYNFTGHEAAGAKWLASRGLDQDLVWLVHHHLTPRGKTLSKLDALEGSRPDLVAKLALVYLADQVSKGDTEAQLSSLLRQSPMLRAAFTRAGWNADALFTRADRSRAEAVAHANRYDPVSPAP